MFLFTIVLGSLLVPAARESLQGEKGLVERGQYIFVLAGCNTCHTALQGTPLIGGRAFPIPLGTVYSTNLTPDKETGIGNWSDSAIKDSIVKGIRPNGERLLPAMPYNAYSGMAEEDLKGLIAYLRTIKPVRKENRPLIAWVPFYRSLLIPLWLKLFGGFSKPPREAPKGGVERGRYLVEHVALCGDCHTARNFLGVPKRKLYLAGTKVGPFGQEVPNITPDRETGIREWSREEIAKLLLTGIRPDLDNVQGLMAEVVEAGFKKMTREDALAIADYLKSIPPIKNKIR